LCVRVVRARANTHMHTHKHKRAHIHKRREHGRPSIIAREDMREGIRVRESIALFCHCAHRPRTDPAVVIDGDKAIGGLLSPKYSISLDR
jgi:hypothetical protein